jgi:hypothetical protein
MRNGTSYYNIWQIEQLVKELEEALDRWAEEGSLKIDISILTFYAEMVNRPEEETKVKARRQIGWEIPVKTIEAYQ